MKFKTLQFQRLISIFNSTSYLCRADNSLGNSEYIFHILVNKPPKLINSTNDHQMISLHLGFSLDCAVTGEPEPTITWYKVFIDIFEISFFFLTVSIYFFNFDRTGNILT